MLDYTSQLSQVDPEKITLESLEEAAQYFIEKLLHNYMDFIKEMNNKV